MKKIIAAALSILVGAFGYTIVDSAIEDRVATLESEVVELREKVSKYHPYYTTLPYEGSDVFATEDYTGSNIGDYLTESSDSKHKFLLRKWSNDRIDYVSPNQYGNSVSQFVEITDPIDDRHNTTKFTLPDIVVTRPEGETVINEGTTKVPVITTPTSEDYYLYITDTSAQITDISIKPSYYYDNNYFMTSVDKQTTFIKLTCKGNIDPSFAGKEVVFSVSWMGNSRPYSIMSNTINADGYLEYTAMYSSTYFNHDATYSLDSISIS